MGFAHQARTTTTAIHHLLASNVLWVTPQLRQDLQIALLATLEHIRWYRERANASTARQDNMITMKTLQHGARGVQMGRPDRWVVLTWTIARNVPVGPSLSRTTRPAEGSHGSVVLRGILYLDTKSAPLAILAATTTTSTQRHLVRRVSLGRLAQVSGRQSALCAQDL